MLANLLNDAAKYTPHGGRIQLVTEAADCLMMLLELQGHEPHVANTGLDALERARSLSPDVVLLDIGLPGLDGYQVAERLRRESAGRVPWLVAITGFGADEDRRRSREAGFDRHLLKAVAASQLQEALAAVRRA